MNLSSLFLAITCTTLLACQHQDVRASDTSPRQTGSVEQIEKPCRAHTECASGVCSHYKKDNGYCAPVTCKTGAHADNRHFFCNRSGKWEATRAEGKPCEKSYQCYQPTCFMDPMCDARPRQKATCDHGRCKLVVVEDACSRKGWKKVLHPDEYWVTDDGKCMESMAQRLLRTVCVPCGNGTCDPDESVCNCPQDCKN